MLFWINYLLAEFLELRKKFLFILFIFISKVRLSKQRVCTIFIIYWFIFLNHRLWNIFNILDIHHNLVSGCLNSAVIFYFFFKFTVIRIIHLAKLIDRPWASIQRFSSIFWSLNPSTFIHILKPRIWHIFLHSWAHRCQFLKFGFSARKNLVSQIKFFMVRRKVKNLLCQLRFILLTSPSLKNMLLFVAVTYRQLIILLPNLFRIFFFKRLVTNYTQILQIIFFWTQTKPFQTLFIYLCLIKNTLSLWLNTWIIQTIPFKRSLITPKILLILLILKTTKTIVNTQITYVS